MEKDVTTDTFLSLRQSEIWDDLCYSPELHELLIGGSAGGGKSTLLCMWQIWRRIVYPGTRGLIGRYTFKDLEDTTLKTFKFMWEVYGSLNPYGVKMAYVGHTARFTNGSEILFRWLKESSSAETKQSSNGRLGSLELTDAAIDEVTEVPKKIVALLNSRIRYRLIDGEPKLAMSCNPAINWVKWDWIKTKKGIAVKLKPYKKFCRLGLDDNPDKDFTVQYRKQLEKLEGSDLARLLYGDWDEVDNERPWFWSFDYNSHTTREPFTPDPFEPIYLSFDFNIEPMTCTAGQYVPGRGVVVFRSHETEGTTEIMCDHLLQFGYQDHIGGLYITGDVNGNSRHTASGLTKFGEISTDYSTIKEAFDLTDQQIIHTGKQNPRLKYSRRLVNHVFSVGLIEILEHECPELLEDIRSAIAKPDDSILKTSDNGMHHADNFRYLIHMIFKNGFKDVNEALNLLNFTPVETTNSNLPAVLNNRNDPPPNAQQIQNRLKRRRR